MKNNCVHKDFKRWLKTNQSRFVVSLDDLEKEKVLITRYTQEPY